MKKRDPVSFEKTRDEFGHKQTPGYRKNRLLFDWLCDDDQRRAFYAANRGGLVTFPSRAERDADDSAEARQRPRPAPRPRPTHLVLDRALIEQALSDKGELFSNLPYGRFGSGSFMLALDPGNPLYVAQRQLAKQVFALQAGELAQLCEAAVQQAKPIALRADGFDLADFALQVAVRFCSMYFGFALKDFVKIEKAALAAHTALAHTILARHFDSDPTVLGGAALDLAPLAMRAAELIDAYALWSEPGMPEVGIEAPGVVGFRPVMQKLARAAAEPLPVGAADLLTGEHLATMVVGALGGTVGNIQAAICIAMERLLHDRGWATFDEKALRAECWRAWRANPPVPFSPRRVLKTPGGRWGPHVKEGDELILALGAATGVGAEREDGADPLVFGSPFTHACLGEFLVLPLVLRTLRELQALPGLARQFDPLDGTPMPLQKKWAFRCTAFPLVHRRVGRVLQRSLNVAMRVKPPVSINAAKLRETIRGAAPRIEQALAESRHVHFAWFEFTDDDQVLVLHTVYDGDFDAYVDHFALAVGDLFDSLFEFIEPAPPRPVSKYPIAFVEMIRRFDRQPVGGYFFSAYPTLGAAQVRRLTP